MHAILVGTVRLTGRKEGCQPPWNGPLLIRRRYIGFSNYFLCLFHFYYSTPQNYTVDTIIPRKTNNMQIFI